MTAERTRIDLTGAVQGVGFRPFVYRLATELGLVGWVKNDSHGVVVEVEGPADEVRAFVRRLPQEIPDRAIVHTLVARSIAAQGTTEFVIRPSEDLGAPSAVVLPDLAACPACLGEVLSPTNRRYRYPFTNCTNCGPRFSIIRSLPYDRGHTTMRAFVMCERCQSEYDTVTDRRFHAQPNACAQCGPRVWLATREGAELHRDAAAMEEAASRIARGQVVAVKGLGGFHLMVLASEEAAVQELRARKRRWEKPLAIMAPSIAEAEALCEVTEAERRALASPEAPIVLLRRHSGNGIADNVAPGNPYLGVMLPYTPLHRLLLAEVGSSVVATSGNLSDEPICIDNDEALRRLGGIADVFLLHDRPIERHVDDSLVMEVAGSVRSLRRARGYAPLPVRLPSPVPVTLAFGAHQKNAVALGVGDQVFISQHIGDLETLEALGAHERVAQDLLGLYSAEPTVVAHDLHPDYASTASAERFARILLGGSVRTVAVQHHHAHLAACLAENGHEGPALGVVWDGTGYGSDGTLWGGEFLYGSARRILRVGHLRPFRLPGGEAAAREPRRSALALLWELGCLDHPAAARVLDHFSSAERQTLVRMLDRGVNAPVTTSCGRLFDAVACLVGLPGTVSYEGQAAMALEHRVGETSSAPTYPLPIRGPAEQSTLLLDAALASGETVRPWQLDWGPLILALLEDLRVGETLGAMATKFHESLGQAIVAGARQVGAGAVALSGGCFQNRVLLENAARGLHEARLRVLLHRQVPPNDGGICLGQVAVAAARVESVSASSLASSQ